MFPISSSGRRSTARISMREGKMRRIALAAAAALTVTALLAGPALAGGKGGGGAKGGGGHQGSSLTGSFSLVLLNSTDGVPHYDQNVTFNVTSTSTQPWVQLTCNQSGVEVSNQFVGFYAGYPWSQAFPLSSYKWPGGAADCNGRLYDASSNATLATMGFHVYA